MQINVESARWPIRLIALSACWLGLFAGTAHSKDTVLTPSGDFAMEVSGETNIVPKGKDDSGREWLIAPIPGANPTFGWTLAMPVAILYRPPSLDDDDPPWITGAGGFYAENDSWAAGLFHRMNIRNDRWRFMGGLAYADMVYNYYGGGGVSGNDSHYVEINQTFGGGLGEVLIRVWPHVYAGLQVMGMSTTVESIRFPNLDPDFTIPDIGLQMNLVDLIPRLIWDTRDNEFYPSRGNYLNFTITLSSADWGSDFEYLLYGLDWNYFYPLAENQVLAVRFAGKYAGGSVPFFRLPALGQGADLRGYVAGVYRDKLLLTWQAEYRIRITPRIGLVGFAGVGFLGSGWDDISEALPSYGAGLRWVIAPENNISFRIDVARGEDNTEWYLGVGEAF